jgi:hypothetical protein
MRKTTRILALLIITLTPAAEAAVGDHNWSQGWGVEGKAMPDGSGHVAVAGTFFGSIDLGGGAFSPGNPLGGDVFLARYDIDGNHVWSRQFTPGALGLIVDAVTAAPDGSIYLAGTFQNGDIDFGGGLLGGAGVNVVAGFEPDGSHRFSFLVGGGRVRKIAASNTAVAFAGYTYSNVDFGGGNLMTAGGADVFLALLEPDGSHRFSQVFGDAGDQGGLSLALDPSDGVVIAASAQSTIDFGGGVLTATDRDLCLAAFDSTGAHRWSWNRAGDFSPGGGILFTLDVAVSSVGEVAVGGQFLASTDLGGGTLNSAGQGDIFLARYDASGAHLSSQSFGGTVTDGIQGVTFDSQGNLAFAGTFLSSSIDVGGGPLTHSGGFGSEWFLGVFDSIGGHLYSTTFPGDSQSVMMPRFHSSGELLLYGSGGSNNDFGGGPLATTQFYLAQLDGAITMTATGPGAVSDLTIDKSGADLMLSWGSDCGLGDTYGIYRGDLALGYGSLAQDSCGIATTSATIPMGAPATEFFLVVPAFSAEEGSYGSATAGSRASAPSACHLQGSVDACAP